MKHNRSIENNDDCCFWLRSDIETVESFLKYLLECNGKFRNVICCGFEI